MPPAHIVGGEVILAGKNLFDLSEREMRAVRGKEISMIFQEPMTSLNPVFTIGFQLREAIVIHQRVNKAKANKIALDMLDLVRISDSKRRLNQYPHELSGGMRQRVMIAMALVCRPKVLIADEPTTALDVTIQAQILNLMVNLINEIRTSVILITHDLGVIAETADDVVVLYAGRVVERASSELLFSNPKHPYTLGLLQSNTTVEDPSITDGRYIPIPEIPGMVPLLSELPEGCSFAPRCPHAMDQCRRKAPELVAIDRHGHEVSCWLHDPRR
jgi:oligopeptide/dipeptide ABC transporter ATP-binding protein